MRRTQIQFDDAQIAALKTLSARDGQSVSALVRRAVDAMIAGSGTVTEDERWRRAGTIVGAFASDSSDVARDHDRYLADALGAE